MTLENIQAGDYGTEIRLTVKQNGVVQDISRFTGIVYLITDPAKSVATKTAKFHTDGRDGIVTYTLAKGDIAKAGTWQIRVRLTTATSCVTSRPVSFAVL